MGPPIADGSTQNGGTPPVWLAFEGATEGKPKATQPLSKVQTLSLEVLKLPTTFRHFLKLPTTTLPGIEQEAPKLLFCFYLFAG